MAGVIKEGSNDINLMVLTALLPHKLSLFLDNEGLSRNHVEINCAGYNVPVLFERVTYIIYSRLII